MAAKKPSKLCIRCNQILPLEKFSANKLWASQQYRDAWCIDCAKKYCVDMDTVKQYCFENNRAFLDKAWEAAKKKAQYSLSNNKIWLNPNTPAEKKAEEENKAIADAFLAIKNNAYAYEYEENVRVSEKDTTREAVTHEFTDEENKPIYDTVWRGWFTPKQIEILDAIYAQYEEDFVLDNVNIRDYARKVAKASLNADIAEDKMRRGQATPKEYADAVKIYDDLSKSSNFAACRRKPGESTGMGSLGEIILKMEVDRYLDTNPFTFPEDDVDKIIKDYRHTWAAVGMDLHV